MSTSLQLGLSLLDKLAYSFKRISLVLPRTVEYILLSLLIVVPTYEAAYGVCGFSLDR
jgi:hypothetical protein